MGNTGGSIVSNDYSVQSLIRSIGDPGAGPSDKTGATLLKRLDIIDVNIDSLEAQLRGLDGDTGTPVDKKETANKGITLIHTVTAGKTFYMTAFELSSDGATAEWCRMLTRDAGDNSKWTVYLEPNALEGLTISNSFLPPRILPAGYDIIVESSSAGLTASCTIHGWEE